MAIEANGVVVQAQRQLGRPWAVVSLSLVFELPDGRETAPYHVAGSGAIDHFLHRFDVARADDLVGMTMTLQLNAAAAENPGVLQVSTHREPVPESIRRAFADSDA